MEFIKDLCQSVELLERSEKSVVQKKSEIKNHKSETMENKDLWSKILNIVITVLTAIATTFGVTSCMSV